MFLVGLLIGTAGGGDSTTPTADSAAAPGATVTATVTDTPAGTAKAAKPAPTVTVTATATKTVTKTVTKTKPASDGAPAEAAPDGKALFKVWGSAPAGADITYGSDSDNIQGKGLPMTKTLPVKDDSLYYAVTAQLQGGGDIHCSVTIDGKTKTGHASGGYNICQAQLSSDFSGGFS
ncbi:MmpS family protein [Streptomyces fuscigenes]|nr:MmpS family protein [Streptomyces fuscigenes]